MSDSIVIPTRQKVGILWDPLLVVPQGPGATLTLPPAEVDGYQSVAFLVISDQPFQVVVQESIFPEGPYLTTATFPSSLDAGSGSQKVTMRVSPAGSFMRILITNTGSVTQAMLQLGALGYPSSGTASSGAGAPTTSPFVLAVADAALPNARIITAGANITIADGGPGGQLVISATGGGGGAPTTSEYILLSADAALPNSRVITAGAGISFADGGPGGPLTISSSGSDATAWHNTGDSFGSEKVIGTVDGFDFVLYSHNQETIRVADNKRVLIGDAVTTFTSTSSVLEVHRSANVHSVISVCNFDTGNASLAGFAIFMDAAATKSAEFITTSSGHTPGGGFLPDGLTIATIGLSGGIRIMTRDAFGYSIKIDADGNNIDAYTIDATGHHMINATSSLAAETLRVAGQTFIDYNDALAFRVSRSGSTVAATSFIVSTDWLGQGILAVGIGTAPTFGELDVCHDWNNQTSGILRNATAGTAASTAWTLFSDGTTRYAEWKITSASLTSGATATYPANAVIISSFACTNGLLIGPLDNEPMTIVSNGAKVAIFQAGIQVGAPTGGDKGAGTINVAGDIYKNDSAYTNPDYVLEHWATGGIKKFSGNKGAKGYLGRMSLDEIEAYCRKNFRLPGIADEAMGMFDRSDFLLARLEEIYTYLFDLRKSVLSGAAK